MKKRPKSSVQLFDGDLHVLPHVRKRMEAATDNIETLAKNGLLCLFDGILEEIFFDVLDPILKINHNKKYIVNHQYSKNNAICLPKNPDPNYDYYQIRGNAFVDIGFVYLESSATEQTIQKIIKKNRIEQRNNVYDLAVTYVTKQDIEATPVLREYQKLLQVQTCFLIKFNFARPKG